MSGRGRLYRVNSNLGWSLPARASRLDDGRGQILSRESCREARIRSTGRSNVPKTQEATKTDQRIIARKCAPSEHLFLCECMRTRALVQCFVGPFRSPPSFSKHLIDGLRGRAGLGVILLTTFSSRAREHVRAHSPDVNAYKVARAESGGCADRPKRPRGRHGPHSRGRHAQLATGRRNLARAGS